MNYMYQAMLLVFLMTCMMMAEAFWTGLQSERSLSYSLAKSLMTGGIFIIYAAIDYMLIVPGDNYLMA